MKSSPSLESPSTTTWSSGTLQHSHGRISGVSCWAPRIPPQVQSHPFPLLFPCAIQFQPLSRGNSNNGVGCCGNGYGSSGTPFSHPLSRRCRRCRRHLLRLLLLPSSDALLERPILAMAVFCWPTPSKLVLSLQCCVALVCQLRMALCGRRFSPTGRRSVSSPSPMWATTVCLYS